MKYYAMGGHYGDDKRFGLVRPSGDRPPYVTVERWKDKLFQCSRHHAQLYEIVVEDGEVLSITKVRSSWWEYDDNIPVVLNDDLKQDILNGVKDPWLLIESQ